MNCSHHAFAHTHAGVVQLDGWRFGWSRGRRLDAFAEDDARLLGERGRTLPFVQTDRSLGGDSRPRGVAAGAQNRCQRGTCVAMIDQQVGALGQADGGLGDPPSLGMIIAARQQMRPQGPPGDRWLQRVPGETLTLRTQFDGLGIAVERETGAPQQRGGLGGVGVETHAAKAVVGLTQMRLGRGRIVNNQLDNAGELLDLEQRMAQAQLGDRPPG